MRSANRQLIRWTCIVALALIVLGIAVACAIGVCNCSAAPHPITCTVNFFYANAYRLVGLLFGPVFRGPALLGGMILFVAPFVAVAFVAASVALLVYVLKRI